MAELNDYRNHIYILCELFVLAIYTVLITTCHTSISFIPEHTPPCTYRHTQTISQQQDYRSPNAIYEVSRFIVAERCWLMPVKMMVFECKRIEIGLSIEVGLSKQIEENQSGHKMLNRSDIPNKSRYFHKTSFILHIDCYLFQFSHTLNIPQ